MATPNVAASACGLARAASESDEGGTCRARGAYPWLRERILQLGGKMLDTRRGEAAIRGTERQRERRQLLRCLPTTLVRKVLPWERIGTSRSCLSPSAAQGWPSVVKGRGTAWKQQVPLSTARRRRKGRSRLLRRFEPFRFSCIEKTPVPFSAGCSRNREVLYINVRNDSCRERFQVKSDRDQRC